MKTSNKKNVFLYSIISIFSLILITFFAMNFSIEKPVVLTKSVIDSIYSYNSISYNYYNEYLNSKNNIDNNITNKTLKTIKYLNIDCNTTNDIEFLKYTPNLQKLTIDNFQNLSKSDVNNLKYLKSLKTLYISIDGNYVLKNPDYEINLDALSNLETLYIDTNLPKEINSYIAYNIIKSNNLKNVVFEDNLSLEELKVWDEKIQNILNSLELNDLDEKEKIFKIAKYIKKELEYDKNVYNYLLKNISRDYSNKIEDYNNYLLSSILNNDETIKDAICCNYAAFANILLYKSEIESYYIKGNINGTGHAWNNVVIDNVNYFMDLTFSDNTDYKLLISDNMKEYKNYSNYLLPKVQNNELQLNYYNTSASKIILKWNGEVINM